MYQSLPVPCKKAVTDSFNALKNFRYNVAVPAPTLYGQFHNLKDINYVLNGLLKIGFDHVYETAKATEAVTDYSKKLLEEGKIEKPVIGSACPAVCGLLLFVFPT